MNMIINIPLRLLHAHPDNPRKDLGDLTELADSIRAFGIMQNLTVVPYPDSVAKFGEKHYTVIAGHRRRAAAELAGLETVPCVERNMDRKEQLSTMLMENLQRSDLTVYEQARGFEQLRLAGCSVDEISEKSGFSKTTVRRRLKMAELNPDTLKEVSVRQLTLEDFDRLSEVADITARNEVLKSIGTREFGIALNRSLTAQAVARHKPEILDWLVKHGVKQIARRDSWSGKYDSLYLGKTYFGRSIDMSKFGDSVNRLPTEEELAKDPKAMFYVLEDRYLSLYQAGTVRPTQQKKSREVLDREKLARETKAEISKILKEHYELRSGFIGRIRCSTKDLEPILRGAAMLTLFGATCYGNSQHSDEACKTLGLDSNSYYINGDPSYKAVTEALNGKDYTRLCRVVYNCFCDSETNTFAQYMTVAGTMPEYNSGFNSRLRFLYDWLELLGYEPCDEEKAMLDGTHELYHRKVKKSAKEKKK